MLLRFAQSTPRAAMQPFYVRELLAFVTSCLGKQRLPRNCAKRGQRSVTLFVLSGCIAYRKL